MSATTETYELNKPIPFTLHVPDDLIETTKQKLELTRYPDELTDLDEDDWSHGSKVKEVQRLADFWLNQYDWRHEEQMINDTFNQYKVLVDTNTHHGTQLIHFAHHPSNRSGAIPLLFASGWPGSFLEAKKLINPLTEPEEGMAQAFHLVVASIPGFGPGDPPVKSGFGPVTVARAFKHVMVEVLGYQHFVTQAGDIGASITRLMALQYPENVRACHHNFMPVRPPSVYKAPLTVGRFLLRGYLYSADEQKNVNSMLQWQTDEGAYGAIQRTKPQSLGFGLGDSPTGLLGWFLEKYHSWMDLENYKMTDTEILNFVMLHWIQGATPGLRMYKASVQEDVGGSYNRNNTWTSYLTQPWGISQFPKEMSQPPVDWLTAAGNLKFYKRHVGLTDVEKIEAMIPQLGVDVGLDHMAMPKKTAPPRTQAGYKELMELLRNWYGSNQAGCNYRFPGTPELEDYVRETLRVAPTQVVWASDWPHTGETDCYPGGDRTKVQEYREVDTVTFIEKCREQCGHNEEPIHTINLRR